MCPIIGRHDLATVIVSDELPLLQRALSACGYATDPLRILDAHHGTSED